MTPEARAHADGFSCRTRSAVRYDANGWQRWCVDCGTEIDERAWDPNGGDVPFWYYVAVIVSLIAIGAAALALAFLT